MIYARITLQNFDYEFVRKIVTDAKTLIQNIAERVPVFVTEEPRFPNR